MKIVNKLNTKYLSDEGYVFKSCSKEWIVVLKKCKDTIINEFRGNIANEIYAKFRANKLKVVDIVHKFTDNTINEITNSYYAVKTIKYKKGEIIEVADFNANLDKVCAPGIHYFKSAHAALYYELDGVENGSYKKWYENGQLKIESTWKGGKRNGLCRQWYKDGQLLEECTFNDGRLDGLYRTWYENEQLKWVCTYKNGKLDGLYKKWYSDGQLEKESTWKDGKRNGLSRWWCSNGQLKEEDTYKGGNAK
jgi:antitoxin component YwqK of YwqJK toxin-antitoxin module